MKTFSKWQKGVAITLLIIGAISLTLGSIAFWIDKSLIETEGFIEIADDLIENEEIRVALAESMVDAVLKEAPPRAILARSFLVDITASVLEEERFQKLFSRTVEYAHTNLMDKKLPEFVFGMPGAMKGIKNGVALFDPTLAEQLPDGSRLEKTLQMGKEAVEKMRWWARFIEQMVLILLLVALASITGGIVLTERKWRGVSLFGWILVVFTAVMIVIMYLTRITVTGIPDDQTIRAAVDVGWGIAVRGIRFNALFLAISGGALVVIGRWADSGGAEKLITWISEQWDAWRSGKRSGDVIWKIVPGLSAKTLAIILAIVGIIAIAWPEPSPSFIALLFGFVLFAFAGLAFMSTNTVENGLGILEVVE